MTVHWRERDTICRRHQWFIQLIQLVYFINQMSWGYLAQDFVWLLIEDCLYESQHIVKIIIASIIIPLGLRQDETMLGRNTAENITRKPMPSKPLKRMTMRKIFNCQLAVAQSIIITQYTCQGFMAM